MAWALPTTRPSMVSITGQRRVLRDISYGPAGASNLLDLYLPPVTPGGRLAPLVVFLHAGAWFEGSKADCPALMATRIGYAVASINYRLTEVAPFPAQLFDCKGAIRWLRAHAQKYGIDPRRVAVFGQSAGGHLAALIGTTGDDPSLEGNVGGNLEQSSRVQAVVDWFGPTDLIALARAQRRILRPGMKPLPTPLTELLGGPVDQRHALAVEADPIFHIHRNDPPFLIMHGLADPLVPPEQSRLLATALENAGVPADLTLIPGAGHGGPPFGTPAMVKKLFDFLSMSFQPPHHGITSNLITAN